MAAEDPLAADVRAALAGAGSIAEVKMFGGIGFMLNGNLNNQAFALRLRGEDAAARDILRECIELAVAGKDVWSVVLNTTAYAGVLIRLGEVERGIRLLGGVDALQRRTGVAVSWSFWRDLSEGDLTVARDRLDANTFKARWDEGQAMTFEALIAEALDDDHT